MSEWTKRPWEFRYLPQHRVRVTAEDGDVTICDIALWTVDYQGQMANGHLIAAAPDLYAALEVMTAFTKATIEKMNLRDTNGIVAASEAIMAKARGES